MRESLNQNNLANSGMVLRGEQANRNIEVNFIREADKMTIRGRHALISYDFVRSDVQFHLRFSKCAEYSFSEVLNDLRNFR